MKFLFGKKKFQLNPIFFYSPFLSFFLLFTREKYILVFITFIMGLFVPPQSGAERRLPQSPKGDSSLKEGDF